MTDLLYSPLGPALILLATALVLRTPIRLRRASMLAVLALFPLAITMAWILRLRLVGPSQLEAVWWPLVTVPLRLVWTLEGWNWLAILLLLLVSAGSLLVTWRLPGARTGTYHGLSLLLLSAAAITVVSDNLLTLSSAWVATDILLIARARGSHPGDNNTAVGFLAGGSLLMLLAISITSLSGATTSLASAGLPAETLALLLLATGLRMAAYPFHLWLGPGSLQRDRGTQWLVSGTALVTGAWLFGQLYPAGPAYWLASPVWPPVLAACTLGAGVAAWAGKRRDRITMLTSSRASWLWLVVALAGPDAGLNALGWALLATVLGLSLFVVGQVANETWGWRVPLVLATLTLAGVPLTVGLPALALSPPAGPLLWLLMAIGEALMLSCVLAEWWRPATRFSPPVPTLPSRDNAGPVRGFLNWPIIRLLLAFAVAAVPAILWGIRPQSAASLAGLNETRDLGDYVGLLALGQWTRLGLSLALGVALSWLLQRPTGVQAELDTWQPRLALTAGLSWGLDAIGWTSSWLENGWRGILNIFEGEGYFGWLVLLLLLTWLVIRP